MALIAPGAGCAGFGSGPSQGEKDCGGKARGSKQARHAASIRLRQDPLAAFEGQKPCCLRADGNCKTLPGGTANSSFEGSTKRFFSNIGLETGVRYGTVQVSPVYPSDSGRAIVRGQVSMAGCMLAETGSGERLAVSLASGF